TGNQFSAAQVDAVWAALLAARSPTADPDKLGNMPAQGDRPFWGLATGFATAADALSPASRRGVDTTLLQPAALGSGWSGPRLLEPVDGKGNPALAVPYQRYELLTKVFNNLTTRSNVFAVWLTVGFFEVTDSSSQPVKLGAEIGQAQGRQVRHRLFAL